MLRFKAFTFCIAIILVTKKRHEPKEGRPQSLSYQRLAGEESGDIYS